MNSELVFDLDSALARLGYVSFRPGQREAIETLLNVGRLLLVAPTGGGKSLAYQLPATVLPGTAIVISPLIALMQDQARALEQRGVRVTFLSSTLPGDEVRRRMARMAAGEYQIVYVAPERLVFPGFRGLVHDIDVPLVAVDEAHCISEWGHDFRPEYMQIGELLGELPRARVLACTATATPIVRDEILARLGLPSDTPQLVRGFARPNLRLRAREVSGGRERDALVDAQLAEALGHPGALRGIAIVYAPTRVRAEEEAERLKDKGWRAAAYHAGMTGTARDAAHRAFASGQVEIIAATIAFGMGIDRPDVRAVVHLAAPHSIEAYYQEVGRAGRDGEPAWGLMLVAPNDLPLRRSLLERTEGMTAEVLEHKWNLFLELMRWVEGGSCRHDAILRYFGDEAETLAGCGRCDVCEALAEGEAEQDPEEVALLVRKALSGVARVHRRFGLTAAVQLLRGASDPRLQRAGLDRSTTFGVLRDYPDAWVTKLVRRCITAGWVDISAGDRPLASLTEAGVAVMNGRRPARLLLPSLEESGRRGRGGREKTKKLKQAAGTRTTQQAAADPETEALFDALREHRLTIARQQGVPPYFIASDRTLRELASAKPRTLDDLEGVFGIGPARAAKYGAGFLDVVVQYEIRRG
ncbi:MAG: RecQ family ATP-dependent DNA helicase [Bacteroidales bacterium]